MGSWMKFGVWMAYQNHACASYVWAWVPQLFLRGTSMCVVVLGVGKSCWFSEQEYQSVARSYTSELSMQRLLMHALYTDIAWSMPSDMLCINRNIP